MTDTSPTPAQPPDSDLAARLGIFARTFRRETPVVDLAALSEDEERPAPCVEGGGRSTLPASVATSI